jgi:uncharacterized protein (TIGR02246 family)
LRRVAGGGKIGNHNREGKHMRRIAILVVCFGLLATPAMAQSKAQIQQLNDQWAAAFNKGNATAVAAMYTQDAYVLPAGGPMVKGPAAIEAFMKQTMQQIGDFKLTTLDVKPLGGNAAREIGTATFKMKSQPPQESAVKYAVVWQKEGGKWKLLQDIWNTDK